jgi:hypothetical protein
MRAVLVASACLIFFACGGSTAPAGVDGGSGGSGSSSGSGSGAPRPDAFVSAVVGVGSKSPPQVCNLGAPQQILTIGTPTGGKPTTVTDGQSVGGQTVHVTCSVTPVGSGFDVNLSATLAGPGGGTLTIVSPAGQGAVTASGGSGITGDFGSTVQAQYGETDCTIAFTYEGNRVPDMPPIASGRIWAHLSCPAARAASAQGEQCDVEADFLFENCAP